MKKTATVGILFVLAALPAFGQAKTVPRLNELATAFAARFNQKDAAGITAFYTDDAVLMPPDLPAVKGRANIEEYYRKGFAQSSGTLQLKPTESSVSGSLGFETGVSSMTIGNPPKTSTGKYVVVYRRVGNDWKIAYDIFNND
jgi:ketosteroid isomerase-like protein